MTDGCIIYERLGEDRVKMVRSNTAQQYFIRKVIVRHLYWGGIYVIKDNEVFPRNIRRKILKNNNNVYKNNCFVTYKG